MTPYDFKRPERVSKEQIRALSSVHEVFARNFGAVIHVDVGATGVGRMVQHQRPGGPCQRGQEKGYFEFGGSTSILLFKPGVVRLDGDIAAYSAKGTETLVRYGEKIGSRFAADER